MKLPPSHLHQEKDPEGIAGPSRPWHSPKTAPRPLLLPPPPSVCLPTAAPSLSPLGRTPSSRHGPVRLKRLFTACALSCPFLSYHVTFICILLLLLSVQLRLPFPSPAEDRKAIKDQIVDMTKKAKGAAAAAARMAGGAP